MKTEILARVAELVRLPEGRRTSHAVSSSEPKDTVEVSEEARKRSAESGNITSTWEKDRYERVAQVEANIAAKEYHIHPEMVEKIAEKIVAIL